MRLFNNSKFVLHFNLKKMKTTYTHYIYNKDILVFDADKAELKSIKNILKKAGYTVHTASDGKSAMNKADNKLPSLILLDYLTASEEIFVFCRQLKQAKKTKDIPVIFFISLENQEEKDKAFELGAADYITKPVESEELLARVDLHMKLREAQHEITEKNLQLQEERRERKKVVLEMEIEQKNFRNIFESIQDGAYISDMDYNILYANDFLIKKFGKYKGRKCYEYFRGRKDVCPWCENKKILEEKSFRGQSSHITEGKIYEVIAAPLIFADGRMGKLEIFHDVTKQKQTENALRRSEEMLQLVLNNTPHIVFWKDKDSVFLGCNQAFADYFGLESPEDVVGKTDYEFSLSKQEAASYRERDKRVLETGEPEYHVIEKIVRHDGIETWQDVSRLPLKDEKGKVVGVLVTVEDITKRKQIDDLIRDKEEQFRNIINHSTNAFYSHTPDHVLTYMSPQIEKFLGYSPEETLVKWTELVSDNPINKLAYEITCRAIETGEAQEPYMVELVSKSGEKVLVEVREAPVVVDGKTVSIVGSLTDITERKKMEEKQLAHLYFIKKLERIDEVMRKSTDFDKMLSEVLDNVLEIFQCDRAWLEYPCDPEAEKWWIPMERTVPEFPGAYPLKKEMVVNHESAKTFRKALETDDVITKDYRKPGMASETSRHFSILNEMHMAFYPQTGKPWMFGIHQCMRYREWTEDEKDLFKEIGRRIGDSVSVMLSFKELRASEEKERDFQEKLTELLGVTSELSQCTEETELWKQAVELGRSKLGFDRMGIWVKTEKTGEMRGTFGTDIDGNLVDERKLKGLTDPECAMGRALELKTSCYYVENEEVMDKLNKKIIGHSERAVAPLWDGDNVIGGISTDNFLQKKTITENDRELLKLYASFLGHLASRIRKEEKERDLQKNLAALHDVSIELSHCKTEVDLWKQAVKLGRSRLGFDRLGIWLKTEEPNIMRGTYLTDLNGDLTDEKNFLYTQGVKPGTLLDDAINSRSSFYFKRNDEIFAGNEVVGHADHAVVPLWDGDIVIGLISTDNFIRKEPITNNEIELLKLYASALGHLVQRLREEKRIKLLNRLEENLLKPGTLHEKLKRITDGIVDIFSADFARVWMIMPGDSCRTGCVHAKVKEGPHVCTQRNKCLHLTASSGRYTHIDGETHRRVPLGCYKIGRVAAGKNHGFLTNDVVNDPRVHNHDWAKELGLVSFMGYRLTTHDGFPLGVLALFSKWPISANEKNLFQSIANAASEVILSASEEETRMELERKMLHAQKLESLGVLAGGIAHDFNNILMAILGYSDLILKDLPSYSPVREDILEIKKASSRAAELSQQMLAYSGKGSFIEEPIDIGALVKEMTHMLEVSISKKAVLKFKLAENLPKFEGDATQIRQIIMNMITNASEAIGDQSGIISISTGAMECDRAYLEAPNSAFHGNSINPAHEGLYVFVEVSDTGCGMDKETQEKLFDPFFTTKFTGRGLGMAAALGIVRGHNGIIKIYSEPGKGTSFKVLFPATEIVEKIQCEPNGKEPEEKSWKGSGTVLLADDEETVRVLGKRMLELIGFSVLTADDGRQAVEIFREKSEEIDCVILDLTMPHLDGNQAFIEINKIRSDVKVILSSGYNEHDATQRFADAGLAGFIQKPYSIDNLSDKMKEVLES